METHDRRFLAKTALILFVSGLTIPFVISLVASETLAMGLGLTSEIIALILGVLSWKHPFGKIATIGVTSLVAMTIMLAGIRYAKIQSYEANRSEERKQTQRSQ
jgi:hypothetical protein